MGNGENKTRYNIKYAKDKLKRIPLDVPKAQYDVIKSHAESRGESVNGFIKRAIVETIERDTPPEGVTDPLNRAGGTTAADEN